MLRRIMRSCFKLRLSTCLVLVFCFCVALGFLRRTIDRQQLANDIRRLGGFVQYWEPDVSVPLPGFAKRTRIRISKFLTGEMFYGDQPIYITINYPNYDRGDETLKRITRSFPKLTRLWLSNARLSSASINSLDKLENLKALRLSSCGFDENAFSTIPQLPALKSANFANSRLPEKAIARIVGAAPNLAEVQLQGNQLSEEWVRDLREQYPQLQIHYPPWF